MDFSALFRIKDLFGFWEWYEDRRYGKHNELRKLARRVLKVFDIHDIPVSRIPWIFPDLNLQVNDFKNIDSVINIINDEFLDNLSDKFFVERYWLDNGIGSPQSIFEHGYNFKNVFDFITDLNLEENEYASIYFLAENGTKFVSPEDHGTHHGLVIILTITTFSDYKESFTYTRYMPLYAGYWHYYKTRMMIKAISLHCFQLHLNQKGEFSKYANFSGLEKKFATEIFDRRNHNDWYPDDYILTSEKSACSKDRKDAARLHEYLKNIGYYEKLKNIRESEWLD